MRFSRPLVPVLDAAPDTGPRTSAIKAVGKLHARSVFVKVVDVTGKPTEGSDGQ